MVKISTIFALGIFVALIPFLGLPNEADFPVKNILFILSGLAIAFLSILIRKELEDVIRQLYGADVVKSNSFTESNPKNSEESDK